MKKRFAPLCLRLFISIFIAGTFTAPVKAQYIVIPDTAFVDWLQGNGFSNCIQGNKLDTSSVILANARSLHCHSLFIKNITGVQYFKNLDSLDFSYCSVSSMPSLPARLTYLNCQSNHISALSFLPVALTTLICNYNLLDSLPSLPASLQMLACSNNQLGSLPALPTGLTNLYCYYNQLNSVPALPQTLLCLACDNNLITALPPLPQALQYLSCGFNLIGNMPALPSGLIELYMGYNKISNLPSLPTGLKYLYAYNNQLVSLPGLPPSLTILDCSANQLMDMPSLPDSMNYLNCSYNRNLTCLPGIKTILYLYFDSTAIICTPDYGNVSNSSPQINSLPLCGSVAATCPSFTDINADTTEWTFKLFPNPAKSYAVIETGSNLIGGLVRVTDVTGREIFKSLIESTQTQIPVSALQAGVYYVQVSTRADNEVKERSVVKKMVVQ